MIYYIHSVNDFYTTLHNYILSVMIIIHNDSQHLFLFNGYTIIIYCTLLCVLTAITLHIEKKLLKYFQFSIINVIYEL